MAFVNEYIPEADYEKYDLRRICGEHNLPSRRGKMHSRSWTIDREQNAFLIKVWSHHESRFEGYAFYWNGEWMFFDMQVAVGGESDIAASSCSYIFQVRNFKLAINQEKNIENKLDCLRAAITALPGGVGFDYAHRNVTVEFLGE